MYVIKRDGRKEAVSFDKITSRVSKLCYGLDKEFVEPILITQKVCSNVYKGVHTDELDELSAKTAVALITTHPDYGKLAARICVSNLQKKTKKVFSDVITDLNSYINPKTNKVSGMVSDHVYKFIMENKDRLNSSLVYSRDFIYEYFGYKTLERSYLLKINDEIVERPQHMIMRVCCGVHCGDIESTIKMYNEVSLLKYTPATPTLFNSGLKNGSLASCFLLCMKGDSIDGIFNTLKDCAAISKSAGGIGFSAHDVRASGSYIRGTNGHSNGLVPMLRVYNNTSRYVDQCFTPKTIVYMENGPIEIQNIQIGNKILSSDGTYQSIDKILTYDVKEDIVELNIEQSFRPVCVTKAHQILALKQKRELSFELIKNKLDKKIIEPELCDAGDLMDGDFLCFQVPNHTTIKDVTFSEEDCYMYGLMVGNGYIESKDASIFLKTTVENKKFDVITFVKKWLTDKKIQFDVYEKYNIYTVVQWPLSDKFPFVKSMLYRNHKNRMCKHIDVQFINLPINKNLNVIKGIVVSIGCFEREIFINLANLEFGYSLKWMLLKCGILPSFSSNDDEHEEMNVIHIPKVGLIADMLDVKSDKRVNYLVHGDTIYSRIDSIKEVPYEGRVYDLEMCETSNHLYTTDIGIVKNGGGKRKGSFAVYLEPHHADIFEFLDLKKKSGSDEIRARDLFYALWVSDLFMERIQAGETWSLFCPDEAPGLSEVHSDEFKKLYERYERQGKAKRVIKAQDLWSRILESQQEEGMPYLLFKDASNRKSNQSNLGTIKSSNLCSEIIQFTSPGEIAVCNLSSIALSQFVNTTDKTYDFEELRKISYQCCLNLNRVIDETFYPVAEAKVSNLRHRPIGIGIQGLADAFMMLNISYESKEAQKLNVEIFETIYYGALQASVDLAKKDGPYESYKGSYASQGLLQFDLWDRDDKKSEYPFIQDWEYLKTQIAKHGLRNSLLTTCMPTASTSQILGNNESFEPYTSNLYVRRTLSGESTCINNHLVEKLIELKLWNEDLKDKIIAGNGSVQHISEIPSDVREVYKTVWEISVKTQIDMSAERGRFICQSQSFNIHLQDVKNLTKIHFYSWKKGLKTGMYYLRTKPAMDPVKVTLDPTKYNTLKSIKSTTTDVVCKMEEGCLSCGS
jgi:ribonucleoside-diphosphate reductase alpha subunit